MATTHYSFPTINGTDTIDGVNAINGLANAVDTALYQVEQEGGGTPGANSINTSMIQNGAVTTEKLQNGAVTTEKLQNGAVTTEKLASAVQSQIQQGVNAETTAQQALAAVNATPTSVLASTSQGTIRAHKYGPLVVIQFYGTNMTITPGANDMGKVQSNATPSSQVENATSLTNSNSVSGIYVTSDGRIGLWGLENASTVDVRASLVYFVGV